MAINKDFTFSEINPIEIQKQKFDDMINKTESEDPTFVAHNKESLHFKEGFQLGQLKNALSEMAMKNKA